MISSKINPDHIHLTIQPTGVYNISQIMQNIKRVSSDHINQILFAAYDESSYHELNWTNNLESMAKLFYRKNNFQPYHDYPKFQWQEGFDDQLIRTKNQLIN